ncbi:HAD-superfamily phosphatase, subfamily IIIC/FkbH-like domain-containing protein [Sphingomonas sp. NFR04]|uniref:HAD-IIIC family phosphatase n=1 Tax=Sphingomonas sp. NFR04 TaxID=1566283 RepID=UPI0008E9F46A|nr:HAD-IIIC family phosphatase [Sphingomonas sp. NFR04]SFK26557.1 HAD-superfamily phosphatase, subfamily IIIC/FkbH-like domain-containing protein [Sphingomonas sp. NFR04]
MQELVDRPTEASEIATSEFDAIFHRLAQQGVEALATTVTELAARSPYWDLQTAQSAYVQLLSTASEGIETGRVLDTSRALVRTPQPLAREVRALLHLALCGDSGFDVTRFSDQLLLCDTALGAAAGDAQGALATLAAETKRRGNGFAEAAEWTRFAIDAWDGFKPKLLIWDLDDTLWHGTLAEGDDVQLIARRAEIVRALNGHGIVSAICSKNDPAVAQARLEAFGLWDAFVFPRIAFVPKGEAVRQMIEDMQLRSLNVLFLDDNPHNLHEVAAACPGIRTIDATTTACDDLLEQILAEHRHIARDRVSEYRVLQTKIDERTGRGISNETFLAASNIHVLFTRLTENVQFADRIEELINRSNQLNYTGSRVEPGSMSEYIMRIDLHDTHGVFVWDKYGNYGLVGFMSVTPDTREVEHFVLSCRVMHMGIEAAMLHRLVCFYRPPDFKHLRKPLPEQPAVGITYAPVTDPANLARIREKEGKQRATPKLRIICDCQSGALQHYSRFADEIEFDANPRLFSLPMMKTGTYREQVFPQHLVFAAATDYLPFRWEERDVPFDPETYEECARAFCEAMNDGERRMLVILPPEDAPDRCYYPEARIRRAFARDNGLGWNALWRALASQYPAIIDLMELTGRIAHEEMVDACHYIPPRLREISGWIDDWYASVRPAA